MAEFDFTEDMEEQIKFSSRRVARRYRMDADDLYQEGMIWCFQHPRRVRDWMNDTDNPKRGWARFTRAVEGAMTKVARTEKAHREGYDPADEEFYGLAQIELCLPALWDQDYRVNGPSRERHERVADANPSEGNTWAVMVLDVEKAWQAADLDARDRSMLRMRFGPDPATFAAIGRAHECAQSTAEVHVKRAMRRLQRALGGADPDPCKSCADCIGSRKVLSNTQARAITAQDYEEE